MLQGIQSITPFLENYFLTPTGLLALLALIPLFVFYLARPQPEEKLMPSMMFFQKQEADSRLRSAFRTLMRNFVLLLHILILTAFALALAEPYTQLPERSGQAVIVVDRSASMKPQDVTEFVEENLAETNTVIASGSRTQVLAEEASSDQALSIVRNIEYYDTDTDIVSGLQTARNYPGELVVASDLDQTVDGRDPEDLLESSSKPVKLMDTDPSNSYAITGLEVGRENTEIRIIKYGAGSKQVEADFNGQKISMELEEGLNVQRVESSVGRNEFKLPDDGFNVDNKAFFMVPEARELDVHTIEDDKYFEKAIGIINQTRNLESLEASEIVYVNGKVSEPELLEKKINEGDTAVVTRNSNALSKVFGFNVTNRNASDTVILNYPQRINLGETGYTKKGIRGGESISDPKAAVKIHGYGRGKILALNIDQSGFKRNILYPVFWKNILMRTSNTPSVDQLNIRTGEAISNGEKTSTIRKTGFHEVGQHTYAANLLSPEESSLSRPQGDYTGEVSENLTETSLQRLAIAGILLLLFIELIYLYWIGELE